MSEDNGDRPPSFQFYPRDFLTSQRVCAMTLEQIGAYVLLLCHAWLSEEPGTLPDDDRVLAALSRAGERWSELQPAVRGCFESHSDRIASRRLIAERLAQRRRYEHAKKGASLTNEARWGKVAQRPDSESLGDRTAVALASASASKAKRKDFDVPRNEHPPADAGQGPVARATGKPGTIHPDAQAQIEALQNHLAGGPDGSR